MVDLTIQSRQNGNLYTLQTRSGEGGITDRFSSKMTTRSLVEVGKGYITVTSEKLGKLGNLGKGDIGILKGRTEPKVVI